jgi:hypothetical protein
MHNCWWRPYTRALAPVGAGWQEDVEVRARYANHDEGDEWQHGEDGAQVPKGSANHQSYLLKLVAALCRLQALDTSTYGLPKPRRWSCVKHPICSDSTVRGVTSYHCVGANVAGEPDRRLCAHSGTRRHSQA